MGLRLGLGFTARTWGLADNMGFLPCKIVVHVKPFMRVVRVIAANVIAWGIDEDGRAVRVVHDGGHLVPENA